MSPSTSYVKEYELISNQELRKNSNPNYFNGPLRIVCVFARQISPFSGLLYTCTESRIKKVLIFNHKYVISSALRALFKSTRMNTG